MSYFWIIHGHCLVFLDSFHTQTVRTVNLNIDSLWLCHQKRVVYWQRVTLLTMWEGGAEVFNPQGLRRTRPCPISSPSRIAGPSQTSWHLHQPDRLFKKHSISVDPKVKSFSFIFTCLSTCVNSYELNDDPILLRSFDNDRGRKVDDGLLSSLGNIHFCFAWFFLEFMSHLVKTNSRGFFLSFQNPTVEFIPV